MCGLVWLCSTCMADTKPHLEDHEAHHVIDLTAMTYDVSRWSHFACWSFRCCFVCLSAMVLTLISLRLSTTQDLVELNEIISKPITAEEDRDSRRRTSYSAATEEKDPYCSTPTHSGTHSSSSSTQSTPAAPGCMTSRVTVPPLPTANSAPSGLSLPPTPATTPAFSPPSLPAVLRTPLMRQSMNNTIAHPGGPKSVGKKPGYTGPVGVPVRLLVNTGDHIYDQQRFAQVIHPPHSVPFISSGLCVCHWSDLLNACLVSEHRVDGNGDYR